MKKRNQPANLDEMHSPIPTTEAAAVGTVVLSLEAEQRIAAAAFESQNGIVLTDPAGLIVRSNKAFSHMTGYRAADLIGRPMALFNSGRQDDAFFQELWATLLEQRSWQGELVNKGKNGRIHTVLANIKAISSEAGVVTHYLANYVDISLAKKADLLAQRLAYYDPLTQLPNRRLLQHRLVQALAASGRSGRFGALYFIDLDNFRALNDADGQDAGDLLLVELAERLRAAVPECAIVARQGGDEFVVLIEDLASTVVEAASLAAQLGDKVRAAVETPFYLPGQEYCCRFSVGVAMLQQSGSVEALYKHAGLALLQAKKAGGNTLHFFDPAMQAALDHRYAMEAELQQALGCQQLQLYYQPQVTSEQRVVGAEALLRWWHPLRGMVLPSEFIPLAEETGLILPLGLWVLTSACQQLKLWEGRPQLASLPLAVNVSARQFGQPDFVAQVQEVLTRTGANPALLKLELTESLVMENVGDAIGKMHELKYLGISFSMDDFGTGFSSLAYLAQLPIDQLKIDKSFVQNIPGKSSDETIARTIISMGCGLKMEVIAEGVETKAQQTFLGRYGCHVYQGYLFSCPLPLTEFEAFVAQS
jgi:diguanylate cyclase (GGDEF)-like protein/PAS domain S-box-containing protein